jgi:hypothetical protein
LTLDEKAYPMIRLLTRLWAHPPEFSISGSFSDALREKLLPPCPTLNRINDSEAF